MIRTVLTALAVLTTLFTSQVAPAADAQGAIPRVVDLGSSSCVPCKLMWPVLEEMKKEFAGELQVEFVDVGLNENLAIAEKYKIELIPTQIFLDAQGKELWRHEGFISRHGILNKWRELKYDFAAKALASTVERWEPVKADDRAKQQVCYMCDGDIAAKTRVTVSTDKGEVTMCSPHCFFIMYSSLTQDKAGFEQKVSVTDYRTGGRVPAVEAVYLYGLDEQNGRHFVKAFAGKALAIKERQASGGSVVSWQRLQANELSSRCGFCDRAAYPEDAALVKADGVYTSGCCSHCALGVAVRTGKDIEVHEKDRLTGEPVVIKTLGGYVASIEPPTAVAWFGMKKGAAGKFASAGCFHQGFFTSESNLKKWLDRHPTETGKMISIDHALSDKMGLTAQQISKACKIGECAPK